MTKDELIKLLDGHEWNNVEFKKAQRGVPESAYETVSSFSNTGGGWLVFGIRDYDGHYEVAGVLEVDKVQNDFLSALRAGNKVNHDIKVETNLIDVEGKIVLAFRIPETSRQDKPIYLNGDIRRSFIRRGGCDQSCTMPEIERFLRDAAKERWDGQVFSYPLEEAFHQESIKGMMLNQWQALGHPELEYDNDRSRKAFEIRLPLSKEPVTEQVTGEVGTKLALSRHQVNVLHDCYESSKLVDLMAVTGRSDRTKFRHQVLNPLLDAGLVEMTIPDKPKSSKQKYRLTDKGKKWIKQGQTKK